LFYHHTLRRTSYCLATSIVLGQIEITTKKILITTQFEMMGGMHKRDKTLDSGLFRLQNYLVTPEDSDM